MRESRRDEFGSILRSSFEKNFDLHLLQEFEATWNTIRRAEQGYRRILDNLESLPIRDRSPDVQFSAALGVAAHHFDFIDKRARESAKRMKEWLVPDELTGVLSDGTKFHIDSATTLLIENLGTALGMFAYENKWVLNDGRIAFPKLFDASEEELNESVKMMALATSWRKWERVEQRRRYWGGEFVEIEEGKLIDLRPGEARVHFEYVPSGKEVFDWIANERVKERIQQTFAELRFETFAFEHEKGISDSPKLLPEEFVNLRELNSVAFFADALGEDIRNDVATYSGLRIVEWLRGYSALGEIASKAVEENKSATQRCLVPFEATQLEAILVEAGLSSTSARIFISKASFSDRSDDLFDCPLLLKDDGSILFFTPAAVHADPGVTTYSNLLSLGETFDGKGKRFEEDVRTFFKERGFSPFSIDTSREGKSYEIDVLVPWDDYLFVFECKNRALSNHHPVRSYYFRKERESFIKQVKRQIDGLLRYPDMSIKAGNVNPREKTIIPVVLYRAPYSEAGLQDGVYVADWSSVSRLFKARYLNLQRPYRAHRKGRLLHRVGIYSFWKGKAPAPDDLIRQLADPVQIRILESRIETIQSTFLMDGRKYGVSPEYRRGPLRIEQLARLLNFDATRVRREDKLVKREVERLNQNLERKELRSQIRSFREKQKRDRT